MRTFLACLLIAGAVPAMPWVQFNVVDRWRIDDAKLFATARAGQVDGDKPEERAWSISVPELARRLEIKEDAVPVYLRGLDPKLPLLVEYAAGKYVCGIWPLAEERLRKELRVELTPALEVKLVNAGKAVHRVVKPNDGSESGWREPEIYFEREVDGKWVRGGKPGRCGMFATEWQKDVVDLKPGESIPLEGYLPLDLSFGLAKGTKAKLRAVYVYAGGRSRDPDEKPDPGPMGKTPPFTLFSEPVEVEVP